MPVSTYVWRVVTLVFTGSVTRPALVSFSSSTWNDVGSRQNSSILYFLPLASLMELAAEAPSTLGQVFARPVPLIWSYVSDAISERVKGPAEADCTPVASASAAARPAAFHVSCSSPMRTSEACIGATRPYRGVTCTYAAAEPERARADESMAR